MPPGLRNHFCNTFITPCKQQAFCNRRNSCKRFCGKMNHKQIGFQPSRLKSRFLLQSNRGFGVRWSGSGSYFECTYVNLIAFQYSDDTKANGTSIRPMLINKLWVYSFGCGESNRKWRHYWATKGWKSDALDIANEINTPIVEHKKL